ncbi:MAG: YCF48-related protein [Candidatus Woesebacteria bacterium]|nr:YCF48-related protein [Candidatus Woesebacteria bacterium]
MYSWFVRRKSCYNYREFCRDVVPFINFFSRFMITGLRNAAWRLGAVGACFVVSLFFTQAASAANWVAETSGTANSLYGIDMRPNNTAQGIAVGLNGTIRYTTDYGKTWSAGNSGTSLALYDVSYAGANIAVAVGLEGKALKTVDSGATWTAVPSGTGSNLYDVAMGTLQYGLAVGASGVTLKTTTYGNSWTVVVSGVTNTLLGVDMYSDGLTGWAVGMGGVILKTTNGGTSWASQTSGVATQLSAVSAVNANTAYAVGASRVILKTTNGGTSWTPITASAAPAGTGFYDVSFKTASDGTVVGTNGVIIHTADGGATWTLESSGTVNNFDGLFVDPASTLRLASAMGGYIVIYDAVNPNIPAAFALSGASPTADTTPTFTWTAATDSYTNIVNYQVMKDGVGALSVDNVISHTISPAWAEGTHDLRVRSVDAAGNWSDWSTPVSVVIDATAPSITALTPASAVVNVPVTFQIAASDNIAVTSCRILVNGDPLAGSATYNAGNGKWEKTHTFTLIANPGVQATCYDGAGNSITTPSTVVSVTAAATDTTAPVVGAITPITAVAGTPVALSAAYSDAVGVSGCILWIDGAAVGGMTLGGASAGANYTFAAAGAHWGQVKCSDAAANNGNGVLTVITVTAVPTPDSTTPVVGAVVPTAATAGTAVALSATVTDNVGVSSCNLWVDGVDRGAMSVAGATASVSYTFTSAGTASVQVKCADAAANIGVGAATTVSVLASGSTPTTPSAAASTVGASPASVVADNASVSTITVTVKNSSGTALSGKTVTLTSSRPAQDTIVTVAGTTNDLGVATFSVKSSTAGVSTLTAVTDGLSVGGASVTFTASGTTPPPAGTPGPGSLIKLVCPAAAAADHPCKAVYFYGADGKRHAFTHSKVFLTWYANFNDVQIVTQTFLSSLPLGKNVAYRPGIKMVKFKTLNTVYVVGRGGLLRPVSSEDVARLLYGTTWNTQIDDIEDSYFMDYAFGAAVASGSDFVPASETAAVTGIDANS